ncbi:hypothetical protein LUZ63_023391 [Rhynchospora breviuscula]|uniref:Schlafen AlbA-2 domain-containing protein n=1 Tax=Rhynchospora breviuscula TaxID=2022672 RepID=A0A9P9Z3H1_9POAL|nr:hypothetical protein LUZ63_023391 [Rhynchospora breviuscula]
MTRVVVIGATTYDDGSTVVVLRDAAGRVVSRTVDPTGSAPAVTTTYLYAGGGDAAWAQITNGVITQTEGLPGGVTWATESGVRRMPISAEEATKLLSRTEGHFLDFKDIRIAPSKLTQHLAAFCNADGGDLYVGVSETNGVFAWDGFSDEEDANGHIQAFEMVSPFGVDLYGEFLRADGLAGLVLHVNALKSRQIRTSTDGKVYKRLGAQSLRVLEGEALTALRRAKGVESFEDETLSIPIDSVTNSSAIIEYLIEAVPTAEPEIYLRGQYLTHEGKPTVAATLLFADEPQAALPKRCGIKVYRYPTETLHEVITNAVLHRDYSVLDDVHIRIFENRIEVQSPGRLPGHITPSNILDERLSRNPKLVRHLNRFPDPPNKDVGEGLDTAFASMKKLNLREPEILERDHSVLVIIRHESLASPEQQLIEYLKDNPAVRNEQARDLTGIQSESRMQKILKGLVAAGEIEHVPGTTKRGYSYRLVRPQAD